MDRAKNALRSMENMWCSGEGSRDAKRQSTRRASRVARGYQRSALLVHGKSGCEKACIMGGGVIPFASQELETNWSGREDLNLRPPGPEAEKIKNLSASSGVA
jgi:hypothetical protein